MTVSELILQLKTFPADAIVLIEVGYEFGDSVIVPAIAVEERSISEFGIGVANIVGRVTGDRGTHGR